MDENERQIRKLNLIVATYQQKLANADLTIADHQADLQMLRGEVASKDDRIRELEASAPKK
jgi:hypothetical protein